MTEDYCEHCDLPYSTCVHGNPPAPPPEPAPRAARTRTTTRTAAATGTTARAAAKPAKAAAPARPRRRTPPEDFEPRIISVLATLGGEATAEDVMDAIGEQASESLRSGDLEAGPTGELRWRTACRTARKHLADGGRLVAPQPGVWRLTDAD